MKLIIRLSWLLFGLPLWAYSSQAPTCYTIEHIAPGLTNDRKKGPAQNVQIKLKKKFNFLSKEIGWVDCWANTNLQKIYLATLKIDDKLQNQGLGKQLLFHGLSFLSKKFPGWLIYWKALPLSAENPTPQDLQRLVKFYCSAGAIDTHKQASDAETEMYYPIRSGAMLAVLKDIFQPQITTKSEKRIILANGADYQTNPHDPLGIIANYMGQTNHLDQ